MYIRSEHTILYCCYLVLYANRGMYQFIVDNTKGIPSPYNIIHVHACMQSEEVGPFVNNCELLMKFFYTHVSWSSLNHCFITPNHKLSDQYHLCKRSKLDSSLWWHSVAVPSLI